MAYAIAISTLAGATAHAQRWQAIEGQQCADAGRHAIIDYGAAGQVRGYIAVGRSSPFVSPFCTNTTNIYVTYTTVGGTQLWARTYDLGGNEEGVRIGQVATNEFIICGNTTTPTAMGNTNVGGNSKIFLMKITNLGAVIWVNTYGRSSTSPPSNEVAADMVITAYEMNFSTIPHPADHDYVVAGYTETGGNQDAYLFRTDSQGNLRWSAVYKEPAGMEGDDYFNAVAECTVGVPYGSAGDIIAAGGTTTNHDARHKDILTVRVNGSTGLIGAFPQGIHWLGANRAVQGHVYETDEEVRSIQELKTAPYAGEIIMVGKTTDITQAPLFDSLMFKDWLNDAFILKTTNAFTPLGNKTWGDGGGTGLDDAALCVREVLSNNRGISMGHVVVTGYMSNPGIGSHRTLGAQDVMLQEFTPGTGVGLQPFSPLIFHGAANLDVGESIEVDTNGVAPASSGFLICGRTVSQALIAAPGDPEALYILHTDANWQAGCNLLAPTDRMDPVTFNSQVVSPEIDTINEVQPLANPDPVVFPSSRPPLCYWATKPGVDDEGTTGASTDNLITLGAGSIELYPNPMTSGSTLNLMYTPPNDTRATVTISDLLGREIYNETSGYVAGRNLIQVKTEGWVPGSYVITVRANGSTTSGQVIIAGR